MDPLKSYGHTKLALAGQLRLLRECLRRGGSWYRERLCEELMVKLAEDRFTLAVLGQFTRGKTSLMNAIRRPWPTCSPASTGVGATA